MLKIDVTSRLRPSQALHAIYIPPGYAYKERVSISLEAPFDTSVFFDDADSANQR